MGHRNSRGFSLLEILISVTIVGTLAGIAAPLAAKWFADIRLKQATYAVAALIVETKGRVVTSDTNHAVCFSIPAGRITLVSGRGEDDAWNTGDDPVISSVCFSGRWKDLSFGYGECGPVPGYAPSADGITFQNNTLVCNTDLTGNAGTVYLQNRYKSAMAITMNSADFGYTIRRWDGSQWRKI